MDADCQLDLSPESVELLAYKVLYARRVNWELGESIFSVNDCEGPVLLERGRIVAELVQQYSKRPYV